MCIRVSFFKNNHDSINPKKEVYFACRPSRGGFDFLEFNNASR